MSEVKRFPAKKFHPDSEVILALHYDDAKSELAALREERDKILSAQIEKNSEWAALREELAEIKESLSYRGSLLNRTKQRADEAQKRLADAERRNGDYEFNLMYLRSQIDNSVLVAYIDAALNPNPEAESHESSN